MANHEVIENTEAERFELRRDGELLSFAAYYAQDDIVVVPHVETVVEHRGEGNAGRLMTGMLDIVRASGRRITPVCRYAASHLREHPEHHDLVA